MRPDLCGSWRRVVCSPTYAALGEGLYAARPVRLMAKGVLCGPTCAAQAAKGSMRPNLCGSRLRVQCGPICAALSEGSYAIRPIRL